MSRPCVFLTRVLPLPVMEVLNKEFDLRFDKADLPLTHHQIMEGAQHADGLISMLSDSIDLEVLEAASQLKIVANYAVGYNNIDLSAAKEKSVFVTNTPGVLTETTADLSWALLMAVARRIPEANHWVKSGQWAGWAPTELMGADIHGKTLGLLGMGRIGQAVARRAKGFGMQILYSCRHRLPEKNEEALGASYQSFLALLERSDFLSLHLPLNDDSYHLIDQKALREMKPGAFLINTSRGAIIDEKALCQALIEKDIAGAGLDVFEAEPVVSPQLLRMENVVTLPHIGSASFETRVKMGFRVINNLLSCFKGQNPPDMVE